MNYRKLPPYRVVLCAIKAEVKAAKMLHQRSQPYPLLKDSEWSLQDKVSVDAAVAHDILRSLQERVDKALRKAQA